MDVRFPTKAISWVEKVAEFSLELCATNGRFVWAGKDKSSRPLSSRRLFAILSICWRG